MRAVDSEPPSGDDRDRDRRRLEHILPELLKRVVDLGLGKLSEGRDDVRAFVNDMKLPKELTSVIAAQLEASKNAIAGSLASELRGYLDRTSLSEELRQALNGMTLEVKTEIRFIDKRSNDPAPGKTDDNRPAHESNGGDGKGD